MTGAGVCEISNYGNGDGFDGQRTASGEIFNASAMTAAHRTLKFGTQVRVTNPANGKSVIVRINDRGPYSGSRCLDLSAGAFQAIAPASQGVIKAAKWEILG
ncbi:septal ring lytic transglycosylase RlpA family protein [Longispora albida]|uniref:septal ring lytic transglycosylase RlpA family protein n=1 Tax=Longispora albida TaxID=203523 RepID=UPI00036ADA5A|nr:septal ring lytic transglycosylase RlpA family protein [Longispora albida]